MTQTYTIVPKIKKLKFILFILNNVISYYTFYKYVSVKTKLKIVSLTCFNSIKTKTLKLPDLSSRIELRRFLNFYSRYTQIKVFKNV